MASSIRIIATGKGLADKILTNAELSKMVDTNDEWIRTRTGIQERRIASPGQTASTMGVQAAKDALAKAGMSGSDLDIIVVGTCTPDMAFPSTACLMQRELDARKAASLDVSAACSGFIYGMSVAENHLRIQKGGYALVVGTEVLSRIVNWKDRNTCVLFGDGAGAIVLHYSEEGENGILATHLRADGWGSDLLRVPAGGSKLPASVETVQNNLHTIHMEGREVFKKAVPAMAKAAQAVLEKAGLKAEDIALVLPHQANIRIIEATIKRLGLTMDNVYLNMHRYGNTSAASIPLALDDAVEEGRLKIGDYFLMVAFGGGLTVAAAVGRWTGIESQGS